MLMGRPPVRAEIRRVFWRLVRQGASTAVAAAAVGVSENGAGRWFAEAGGMPPMKLTEPSGRYVSFTEREEIAVLVAQKLSVREIARRIGRAPSTVSRELRRNCARTSLARGGRPQLARYRASSAQAAAEARARRPKPAKLAVHGRLREYVQEKLDAPHRWSPEQIAARLRVEFPHDESMRVSHETIYQSRALNDLLTSPPPTPVATTA
jgi:IS30 family transposase